MYMLGIVLGENGHNLITHNVLVKFIDAYPWNWSAWIEMQTLCMDIHTLKGLELNYH